MSSIVNTPFEYFLPECVSENNFMAVVEPITALFKKALANTIECLVSDLVLRGLDSPYYLEEAVALTAEENLNYEDLAEKYDLVALTERLMEFDFKKVHSFFPTYTPEGGCYTAVFPVWYYANRNGNINVEEILEIIKPNIMHPFYECFAAEGHDVPFIHAALNGKV